MNIPTPSFSSGGLLGRVRRRLTRLQARRPVDCAQGRYLVSFSFDDFPRSAATTGAAILEDFGWRGTYYASASFENTKNHLGDLFRAEDIAALVSKGHEIGCHTEHHINCALNAPVVLEREIRRNQERLRALGAPALRSFAFPFGEASPAAKTALSQHYACLRGIARQINRRGADASQLGAVALEGDTEAAPALLAFVDDLKNAPGWLIFFTHDVRESPGEWGCTPDLLRQVCEAVHQAGCEVLPVGEAFDALKPMEKAA